MITYVMLWKSDMFFLTYFWVHSCSRRGNTQKTNMNIGWSMIDMCFQGGFHKFISYDNICYVMKNCDMFFITYFWVHSWSRRVNTHNKHEKWRTCEWHLSSRLRSQVHKLWYLMSCYNMLWYVVIGTIIYFEFAAGPEEGTHKHKLEHWWNYVWYVFSVFLSQYHTFW